MNKPTSLHRMPDTMVEPPHRAASPRHGGGVYTLHDRERKVEKACWETEDEWERSVATLMPSLIAQAKMMAEEASPRRGGGVEELELGERMDRDSPAREVDTSHEGGGGEVDAVIRKMEVGTDGVTKAMQDLGKRLEAKLDQIIDAIKGEEACWDTEDDGCGDQKEINDAEAKYRAAIKNDLECAEAHFRLGDLLYYDLKDIDVAEAAYRTVIATGTDHTGVHFYLGLLLDKERQDIHDTEGAYRAAITADPEHDNAFCSLGVLLCEE